jgi:hypothetical protein
MFGSGVAGMGEGQKTLTPPDGAPCGPTIVSEEGSEDLGYAACTCCFMCNFSLRMFYILNEVV